MDPLDAPTVYRVGSATLGVPIFHSPPLVGTAHIALTVGVVGPPLPWPVRAWRWLSGWRLVWVWRPK